jgi:hypothetical protein
VKLPGRFYDQTWHAARAARLSLGDFIRLKLRTADDVPLGYAVIGRRPVASAVMRPTLTRRYR